MSSKGVYSEVNEILAHETDVLSLEVEMQQKVRERVGRVQRDMVLREQMKVLQHELGEDGDEEDYADEYEAGLYEITCPNCGEVVCVDEDMLASDDLTCPSCGTKFEVDFSEDDDACEGCEGCCGGKDEE